VSPRLRAAGVAVTSLQVPAQGTEAGDWVDVFDLAGGRVGLSVGDICGHGPAAATRAGWVRRLLRASLVNGWEPGVAARRTVEQIGDTGEGFASAVVAVLDPASGLLRYANAGHPEPLLLRGGRPGPIMEGGGVATMPTTGPILADLFVGQDVWGTEAARLGPNDQLVIYTDGLVEARDESGAQFGTDRLIAEVCRPAVRTPQLLLGDVFGAVEAHAAAGRSDDRTALVLTRTVTGAPVPSGSRREEVRR
jgi:sigma-B regulation protein RsbU (phosphoserine phosphatase)